MILQKTCPTAGDPCSLFKRRNSYMKVNLIGSSNNKKILIEILKSRQIGIEKTAPVNFVERGNPIPEKGISVVFDPANPNDLIEFLDSLNQSSKRKKETEVVTGKREDTFKVLQPDVIYYFFSDGNYVYCQTKDNKFEVKKKLYELGDEFSHKGFVRVSKSHVINILRVKEIIPWFGGRLLLTFKGIKDEIVVSRRYMGAFKKFLGL